MEDPNVGKAPKEPVAGATKDPRLEADLESLDFRRSGPPVDTMWARDQAPPRLVPVPVANKYGRAHEAMEWL